MIFIFTRTTHVSERPSLGMTPAFPPILFSFAMWWNKLSVLEWHCYLRKAHIPHNYSCYWPTKSTNSNPAWDIWQRELRRVLSVSLASVSLHQHRHHRRSCVVYLFFNPKEQSQRGQTSGHTAPLIFSECWLIAETTSWVYNERHPHTPVGCKLPSACWSSLRGGGGRPGWLVDSWAQIWIVEITELFLFAPCVCLHVNRAGFCIPLAFVGQNLHRG